MRVLDVGCGAGATGAELRRRGHDVCGLDVSTAAIAEARRVLARADAIDLDTAERLPYRAAEFDCILLSDVLEHLRDPGRALALVHPHLKDDGHLVLSVPNIANYKVRWHLLWGRFDAGCAPILEDASHIKFFTLKTLSRLLRQQGFSIIRIDCTAGIDLPLGGLRIGGVFAIQKIRRFISRLWKTMFAFQFVIVARKAQEFCR